jgi:hypothetical protein
MGRGRPRKNTTQGEVAVKKTATTPENEVKEEKVEVEKVEKVVTKPEKVELTDEDEIDIIALDSNVTYWDKATDETYVWHEVGEIVSLQFAVIKNMWRNHKDYFRNFLLKPLDERVIEKLGLNRIYDKYDFLNDGEQYTRKNVDDIIKTIKTTTSGFQFALCNNIKNMIISGEITDVYVINTLGRYFNVDFITLLD